MNKEIIVMLTKIFGYILLVVMGFMGGVSTLALVISLPSILIWKIYRKIKYRYKITD